MPTGGVARRATQISALRQASEQPLLLLDAGNTLFGQYLAQASEGRVIVQAMNLMGYDAMTVGRLDLYMGAEMLLARAQEADFAMLSANLVSNIDQQPIVQPYMVIERGDMRIGVIGITEADAANSSALARTLTVLDPVETVKAYLPQVQAESDIVIVLSHLGLDEDRALALAVPGLTAIVGGRTRQVLAEPVMAGNTAIVQMGYDGEYLGRFDLTVDVDGRLATRTLSHVDLGPGVPDDPAMVALLSAWQRPAVTPTVPKP